MTVLQPTRAEDMLMLLLSQFPVHFLLSQIGMSLNDATLSLSPPQLFSMPFVVLITCQLLARKPSIIRSGIHSFLQRHVSAPNNGERRDRDGAGAAAVMQNGCLSRPWTAGVIFIFWEANCCIAEILHCPVFMTDVDITQTFAAELTAEHASNMSR